MPHRQIPATSDFRFARFFNPKSRESGGRFFQFLRRGTPRNFQTPLNLWLKVPIDTATPLGAPEMGGVQFMLLQM